MTKIHIEDIIGAMQSGNFTWLLIPIFFVGIITDKYQEEYGTSVGNAISNGAMIIFTGFSWIQLISSRTNFPIEATISQYLLSFFIISYGFAIIASGFTDAEFAKKYGRIRVITFMLMFFTMIIYVPILYNFISILLFIFIFPFYYAFITELVKIMPSAQATNKQHNKDYINLKNLPIKKRFIEIGKRKLQEYLE